MFGKDFFIASFKEGVTESRLTIEEISDRSCPHSKPPCDEVGRSKNQSTQQERSQSCRNRNLAAIGVGDCLAGKNARYGFTRGG